jgi:hypothetical protein
MAIVGCAPVVRVTVNVSVSVVPDAVLAVTVSTFVPVCKVISLADQLVVPLAVPLPPRLFAHRTCVTPALLDTVPASLSEDWVVL